MATVVPEDPSVADQLHQASQLAREANRLYITRRDTTIARIQLDATRGDIGAVQTGLGNLASIAEEFRTSTRQRVRALRELADTATRTAVYTTAVSPQPLPVLPRHEGPSDSHRQPEPVPATPAAAPSQDLSQEVQDAELPAPADSTSSVRADTPEPASVFTPPPSVPLRLGSPVLERRSQPPPTSPGPESFETTGSPGSAVPIEEFPAPLTSESLPPAEPTGYPSPPEYDGRITFSGRTYTPQPPVDRRQSPRRISPEVPGQTLRTNQHVYDWYGPGRVLTGYERAHEFDAGDDYHLNEGDGW